MTFHIRFIKGSSETYKLRSTGLVKLIRLGECFLRGCILIKITHAGRTLMILIFDGETSSKSMLLLMRRHLVFRFLR